MVLGKSFGAGDEVRQFLIGQHNGNLGIFNKVDAALQLHQLPDMVQKLVRILIIELLIDGYIVDAVVFQTGCVALPLNHPLNALIGHIPADVVLVVGAEDKLPAAVGVGGVVGQYRVAGGAASGKEVQDDAVRLGGYL